MAKQDGHTHHQDGVDLLFHVKVWVHRGVMQSAKGLIILFKHLPYRFAFELGTCRSKHEDAPQELDSCSADADSGFHTASVILLSEPKAQHSTEWWHSELHSAHRNIGADTTDTVAAEVVFRT